MAVTLQTPKRVLEVRPPAQRHWVGDGFHVRSIFSYDADADVTSPFLLLDYGAPSTFRPSAQRRGVGPHPHRGFETVTVAYQGEIEHRDSAGHAGRIGPGDVQWMTAGSGVVHEELHSHAFARQGGALEMAQVWVNLPAKHKLTAPRYQDLLASAIPTVELPDGAGRLRVIAGEVKGARGPARTFSPVSMWDVRLEAGRSTELSLPEGHIGLILVLRGTLRVNDSPGVGDEHLVILSREGRSFRLEADTQATLLVLGGEPIAEPVAGHGPFVMNTWDEIRQAIDDFSTGRMGTLEPSDEA